MTDRQIELLKKALDLYEFTIEQRREGNSDTGELNEFFYMREALAELLGVSLDD